MLGSGMFSPSQQIKNKENAIQTQTKPLKKEKGKETEKKEEGKEEKSKEGSPESLENLKKYLPWFNDFSKRKEKSVLTQKKYEKDPEGYLMVRHPPPPLPPSLRLFATWLKKICI